MFPELDKWIRKFMCKRKCAWGAKTILKVKNNAKEDLDLFYHITKYFIHFFRMKGIC